LRQSNANLQTKDGEECRFPQPHIS
jgi:hypothetical protein